MKQILLGIAIAWLSAASSLADEPLSAATESVLKELDQLEKSIEFKANSLGYEQINAKTLYELNQIHRKLEGLNKAIYRYDDRKNYYDVGSSAQSAANATVVLVDALSVNSNSDGSITLPSQTAGLCTPSQIDQITGPAGETYKNEPFYDEPAPGFCSGFKVGRDLIATAAHCIRNSARCQRTKFVAGFYKTDKNAKPELTIPANKVYSCKKLVARKLENGSDWAIVQVDRELSNMPTVTLADKTLKKEDGVTVVGYPMGLPVKIAANGQVRSLESSFFVANLDTYGGNSGSPVFNTLALVNGHLVVEGILVRGEDDFLAISSPCRISKRCPVHGCRGEDVVYADEFKSAIPTN